MKIYILEVLENFQCFHLVKVKFQKQALLMIRKQASP